MDHKELIRRFAELSLRLAGRVRAVAPHAPVLVRKPAIALYTLATARAAQLVLVGATLAMLFVIQPLVASGLDKAMPENRALFGLVKKRDVRSRQIQEAINWSCWLAASGTVLLLIWLHIPAAIEEAGKRARRTEERGDRLGDERPREGLILYRRALALSTDSEAEARLGEKIAALVRELLPAASGDGTMVGSATPASPPKAASPSATNFADSNHRYEIVRELGQGNMGVVFDAVDHVLDRPVALKQLPAWLASESDFVARFQQEARALARLSHPHIVQVYDFFEARGRIFMVLERVAGGDLAQRLEQAGRHEVSAATDIAAKMAGALGYAHDQGIVHRDFKPSNVLLTEDGVPKVTDFGLAKIARSSTLTQEGAILGSPLYMSPEQAAGKAADARSDIYALGITLYELLTGQTPFTGDTAQVLAQHITQPPPDVRLSNPEVPEELGAHLTTMLAKLPDERPQSMREVIRGLAPFAPARHSAAV